MRPFLIEERNQGSLAQRLLGVLRMNADWHFQPMACCGEGVGLL